MEYGFYDMVGNINLDYHSNDNNLEASITLNHEIMHKILTENTNFGYIHLALNCIGIDSDLSKENSSLIYNMNKILYDNSVQVQESLAVFYELRELKTIDKNEYDNKLNILRGNTKYYKTYKFCEIEDFLRNDEEHCNFNVLFKLANIAMNINLNKIDPFDLKLGKKIQRDFKLSPNIRFKRLISYIKDNNIKLKDIEKDGDVEIICNKINIDVNESLTLSEKNLWMNKFVTNIEGLKDINHYIDDNTFEFCEDAYFQFVKGYSSIVRYNMVNCDVIEYKEKYQANLMIYANYWKYNELTTALVDIYKGNIIPFDYNKSEDIAKISNCILVDRFDFARNNIQEIFNDSLLMIKLNSIDKSCLELLDKHSYKMYFLVEISEAFCMLFIKGHNNTIFYESILTSNAKYLHDIILKNYTYINTNDTSLLDDYFITSNYLRCIYEDVIQWESQTTFHFNLPEEKSISFTRINLTQ